MSSDRLFSVLVLLGMLLMAICIVGGADYMTRRSCLAIAQQAGVDVRYGFFDGCYVHDGDRWVPREYWVYHGRVG